MKFLNRYKEKLNSIWKLNAFADINLTPTEMPGFFMQVKPTPYSYSVL